jgi:hypothetical protein
MLHKTHDIVTSSCGGLSPPFRAQGGPLDPVVHKIRARLEATRGSPVADGQVLDKRSQQRGILVVTSVGYPHSVTESHQVVELQIAHRPRKAERIRECLDIHSVPDLTTEELQLVVKAGAQLHNKFFVSNFWRRVVDCPDPPLAVIGTCIVIWIVPNV